MLTSIRTSAVGYIRVSTLDQALEGVSLAAQEEKIRTYCNLHSLELAEVCSDEGISGKRSDNRPGLQRALTEVCGKKGVLIVYSLSRLARSTRDCIAIADRLNARGADLASITDKLDTTSSIGKFFFTLMAALGQLERDQISERTTLAMAHLRRLSRRISRAIPFGIDLHVDGRTLIPNAWEMTIIDRIRGERESGFSFSAIATRLNADGIKPKSGRCWYHSSVKSVLVAATKRAA